MGVLMTWVTTTDGPSQEQHARNAPSPPPTQSEGSREPWSLPRAMWDEEPGWDDRRVVVVEASALRALGTAAAMEGYLWIPLEPPRPVHRGKLALHIEESIESALQQRGAPFPGIGASTDLDASLGDQLYRARLVEMRGIALGVPDLGGIANLRGVLEAEDSAVLRWWLAAALDRPVRVVLSAENRAYRVYPSPVGFDALLEGFKGSFGDAPSPRAPSAETAQSVVAMELSELPPAVTEEGADDLAADVELPELDRALGLEPAPDRLELCPAEGDASDEPEAPDALAAEAFASDSARALAEALIVSAEESPGGAARVEPIAEPIADPIADPIAEPSAEVASDPTVAVAASEPEAALVASAEVDSAQVDSAQVDVSAQASDAGAALVDATSSQAAGLDIEPAEAAQADPAPVASVETDAVVAAPRGDVAPTAPEQGGATEAPTGAAPVGASADSSPVDVADVPAVATEPAEGPSSEGPSKNSAENPSEGSAESVSDDLATQRAASPAAPQLPVVKSTISMDAARRAAARRAPFVMAAEDEPKLSKTAPPPPAETTTAPIQTLDGAEASEDPTAPAPLAVQGGATEPAAEVASDAAASSAPSAPSAPSSTSAAEDPFDAFARQHWKSWIRELESARGPKPLALIERMFVSAYTRLDTAVQRGIGDESARAALDLWRSSFSKSYTEAFDALRLRGKRPTMVLDVPELAQRVGRLHGARRVQLLLVDGMRFDLGMMVQDRLKQCAEASLTERMLLWSALPSTTTNQLELLGKGPDGLKEMAATQEEEAPAVVARGRAAHGLRRIRTGRRELFKLDIVEARLREAREGANAQRVRASLPAIADDVATAVADHFAKQAPRTLVVLFGDHGFRLHDDAPPTEEVTQGGASPEEVLVPAFAWLTGAVH